MERVVLGLECGYARAHASDSEPQLPNERYNIVAVYRFPVLFAPNMESIPPTSDTTLLDSSRAYRLPSSGKGEKAPRPRNTPATKHPGEISGFEHALNVDSLQHRINVRGPSGQSMRDLRQRRSVSGRSGRTRQVVIRS